MCVCVQHLWAHPIKIDTAKATVNKIMRKKIRLNFMHKLLPFRVLFLIINVWFLTAESSSSVCKQQKNVCN